jgi:CCR4-NOT transcription complex subunit 6
VEVVKSQFFLFRSSLEGFCRGLGIPAESKLYDSLYSRMDGCEVIIVRDVRTGRIACVTNVHLYWNPRFPDVKVLQVMVPLRLVGSGMPMLLLWTQGLHTLQCIENLITEYLTECCDSKLSLDTLPVIITGDFNSLAVKRTPDAFDSVKEFPEGGLVSGVYTLFTTGSLSPSHPEHPAMRGSRFVSTLTSPFPPFKSAYKKCTGADPVFTTKVSDFEGTLDFIFVR